MIDLDTARQIAARYIREGETQHAGDANGDLQPSFTPMIVDSLTRVLDFGWVFFFDSQEHQKTGDFRHALAGNAPIIVDAADGSIHPTGTARPVEHYIEEYSRQRR